MLRGERGRSVATSGEPEQEFWLVRALRKPGRHWWWIGPLVAAAGWVGSFLLQEAIPAAGNTASILGLVVTLVGLPLTLWAVLETQRVERKARQRVEEAIREAEEKIARSEKAMVASQDQIRQIIVQFGQGWFRQVCEEAYRLLKETRTGISEGRWERVTEKLLDTQRLCRSLAESTQLSAEEREALVREHLNVDAVLTFIGRHRIGQERTLCWLPPEQTAPVNALNAQIMAILARLSNPLPQVPHAGG